MFARGLVTCRSSVNGLLFVTRAGSVSLNFQNHFGKMFLEVPFTDEAPRNEDEAGEVGLGHGAPGWIRTPPTAAKLCPALLWRLACGW